MNYKENQQKGISQKHVASTFYHQEPKKTQNLRGGKKESEKESVCVHVKVFEAVGIANKAGSRVIVHLPTRKAQRLPPSQRLLHPLLPFLAHTARPDHSKSYT